MAGPEEKNAIPGDTTTPPTPTSVADKKENTPIDNVVSRTPVPPSRFRLWYALTVFAAVSLIALSTETETSEWRVEEQWVLSVTLMSLILGSFASLANIRFQAIFVGMPLEGLLVGAALYGKAIAYKYALVSAHSVDIFLPLSASSVVYSVGILGWWTNCDDGSQ